MHSALAFGEGLVKWFSIVALYHRNNGGMKWDCKMLPYFLYLRAALFSLQYLRDIMEVSNPR
jgi:hypothetical protein